MAPDCSSTRCGSCRVTIALKKTRSERSTRIFSAGGLLVHWTTKQHQSAYNKKMALKIGTYSMYVISSAKGQASRRTKPGQSASEKRALLTQFVETTPDWTIDPESTKHVMCARCAAEGLESPQVLVFAPERGSGEVNRSAHMAKYHDGTTPTKAARKKRVANRTRRARSTSETPSPKSGLLLYMKVSPGKRSRLATPASNEDMGSGPLSDADHAVGIHLLSHCEPHQSASQYCSVSARAIRSRIPVRSGHDGRRAATGNTATDREASHGPTV